MGKREEFLIRLLMASAQMMDADARVRLFHPLCLLCSCFVCRVGVQTMSYGYILDAQQKANPGSAPAAIMRGPMVSQLVSSRVI